MQKNRSRGFTLLELLIVIAIIAILSVALVIVINPAETLKKSRDANRISDLNTIKTALGVYMTSTTTPDLGACSATKSSSTTAVFLTDGAATNWIDVNLDSLTSGSPISNLPRDPINDNTYAYWYKCSEGTSMTFEVSADLESAEYSGKESTDGGNESTRYEVGTKLSL